MGYESSHHYYVAVVPSVPLPNVKSEMPVSEIVFLGSVFQDCQRGYIEWEDSETECIALGCPELQSTEPRYRLGSDAQ